ncbi:hypothetical protein JCM10207_007542 [Rhodosporidiobolus poonsookiae]
MADPSPPGAQELVQQLDNYAASPTTPDQLVQLLRPPRLGLRSTPSLRNVYGSAQGFWPALAGVWKVEADRLAADDKSTIPAVTALAAFVLSLSTQNPHNQEQAVAHVEPELRRVLLTASSLFNLEHAEWQGMTRVCCQTLANLVTANEKVAASFFPERLQLEEQDRLFERLFASPDQGTIQALLIFLLNSIHGSHTRALLLGTSKAGAGLLDRLMVLVDVLFNDESPEGIANEDFASGLFGLAFAIVQQLISLGVFEATYDAHPLMPGYHVDPSLVTLLKFVDGHLSTTSRAVSPRALALVPFLVRQLQRFSDGLERIRDAGDVPTFQAAVLVLHCLCSVGLALEYEEGRETEEREIEAAEVGKTRKGMVEGVEGVVALLRFSQTLLPPPQPRPAPPTPTTAAASPPPARFTELDPSSAPSPPASAPPPAPTPASSDSLAATPAVAQLQRTCAQYLSIVSFAPPGTTKTSGAARNAQDRTRESGGLGVLLSMCQIDERNPTMREHALFAIRTLLKGNQESQDFVEGIKPEYLVGPGGELLDLPPALRKE